MKDLEIQLENRPGVLADMGEALASAGISIEGGGAWVINNNAIAHFLFKDTAAARKVLEEKGIEVIRENEIIVQRLKQDEAGQLGKLARLMQKAGVNIQVIYSDHYHQLILVVDDPEKARDVSDNWTKAFNNGN